MKRSDLVAFEAFVAQTYRREAVPRAMLPRLNGGRNKTSLAYDDAVPELKPAVLAVAMLDHQARTARKARAA